MLYQLTLWLRSLGDIAGINLFGYVTFRAAAAAISALLIAIVVGPSIIRMLKKLQIGEQAKQELQSVGGHSLKAGTPTMGGLIVLAAVLIPTLLWANILNMYVVMAVFTTAALGAVGFLDDYLKVIKKLPKGLIGRYKIVGQVTVGLIVGSALYFVPEWFSPELAPMKTLTTIPFE